MESEEEDVGIVRRGRRMQVEEDEPVIQVSGKKRTFKQMANEVNKDGESEKGKEKTDKKKK